MHPALSIKVLGLIVDINQFRKGSICRFNGVQHLLLQMSIFNVQIHVFLTKLNPYCRLSVYYASTIITGSTHNTNAESSSISADAEQLKHTLVSSFNKICTRICRFIDGDRQLSERIQKHSDVLFRIQKHSDGNGLI